MKADTTSPKSFVMELADLQHDRRETTFAYGEHEEIPVVYNPGAFTRAAAEREDEQDDVTRREAWIDALEDAKADRFLTVESRKAVIDDAEGLVDYLIAASEKALRRQRDAIIDTLAEGVLLEWPISQGGVPMPISREAMLELPYMFLASMYGAIMEDMSPGKKPSRGRAEGRKRR